MIKRLHERDQGRGSGSGKVARFGSDGQRRRQDRGKVARFGSRPAPGKQDPPSMRKARGIQRAKQRRGLGEPWVKQRPPYVRSTGSPARTRYAATTERKRPGTKPWPAISWSGEQDLNLRPLDPQSSALPNCAITRCIFERSPFKCRKYNTLPGAPVQGKLFQIGKKIPLSP